MNYDFKYSHNQKGSLPSAPIPLVHHISAPVKFSKAPLFDKSMIVFEDDQTRICKPAKKSKAVNPSEIKQKE